MRKGIAHDMNAPPSSSVNALDESLQQDLDGLRRKSIERLFRSRRVDIVPLSTTEDYLLPLRAFFEQRERRLAA